MTTTPNLGLTKDAETALYSVVRVNANSDRIDYFAGEVNEALNGKQDELTFDSVPTEDSTNPVTSGGVYDALNGKQDELTFDTTPTDSSTNPVTSGGVHTALGTKMPLGVGTVLGDDADLFTLPVGKYYRSSAPATTMSNVPSDVTTAFYCEVVNTISTIRRKIFLYPCTAATSDAFYTCLETSVGYGTWYKFTGEAVT